MSKKLGIVESLKNAQTEEEIKKLENQVKNLQGKASDKTLRKCARILAQKKNKSKKRK